MEKITELVEKSKQFGALEESLRIGNIIQKELELLNFELMIGKDKSVIQGKLDLLSRISSQIKTK
jgi:hypothetical protein